MKKYKEKSLRFCTVLLSLLLCITFMPAGAFANDEVSAEDTDIPAVELQDQVSEDAADVQETEPVALAADDPTECTHDSLKRIPAVKAKCSKNGSKEYYQCSECGKKFLDADGTQEVTDESQIVVPVDPNAHEWGEWEKTREATPDQMGELTRVCALCGKTETEEFEYMDPVVDPGDLSKTVKINGIEVRFLSKVYNKPDKLLNDYRTGRVWIKGQKTSMKVNWISPSDVSGIDGFIILRKTGSNSFYKEVGRVSKSKTTFLDKTASKKNTTYRYMVLSYVDLSDVVYVSQFSSTSDWAAGRTTDSKLKNVYTGTMNKKTAKLQSKSTVQLKVTIASPSTKFMPKSRRWSSSNKNVATVSSGKVTAKAPGTATIRCRLASGSVVTSKITVVGAFKPAAPKLEVDYATTSSIHLKWNKVKNATSYDVYKSNDGLHWDKTPKNTTNTTIGFTGLTKDHRYTFYVIARNDHKGVDKNGNSKTYTALSDNSNVLNQKAVVRRRPMTLTGWPTKKTLQSGSSFSVTIKVNPPLKRKASLQMKSGKKWVNKKTITLPSGSSQKSVKISFPNDWYSKTTEWRLVVPATTTTSGYTTKTLTIKSTRRYQNPSSYVQIQDSISKHGYSHYVSPVLVNGTSTKSDHVNALIKTAKKYLGDKYVQSRSGAPGKGIDESGLIMQACYGAGVDLWPISPSTRPYNCIPKIMNSKLRKITFSEPKDPNDNNYTNMTAGDLIFFSTSKGGTPIHAAIYTGWGGIIHADPIKGKVNTSTIRALEDKNGSYKYYVVGVRRIFN